MENPPKRKEGLGWQNYDGMTVILNPELEKIHELNPTGSWLWERLDGAQTVSHLTQSLSEAFAISPSSAEKDVQVFLAELEEHGLVQ